MTTDRPLANPIVEERAVQWRSEGFSPEEWAARNAHRVMSSSLDEYRYADPVLDQWIQDVHEILRSPAAVQRCRLELLSAEEREQIERELEDPF